EREGDGTIDVLMQAIEVARAIPQHEGSRPRLSLLMAALQQPIEGFGEDIAGLEQLRPGIRHFGQAGVEAVPQTLYERRQGVAEILILAFPEAVMRHVDAAAEKP